MRHPLPIDALLPRLVASLRSDPCLVLKAPPGAGKTTRVPSALVDAGMVAEGREVVVLEPRRIAARMAARRVAAERNGRPGGEVGYRVRFESAASDQTRICYETEGVLLRRLVADPALERAAAVVLDEFHERSADADLSLALLREVQMTIRPDLRIVVMSATLDPGRIADYLGGCPVLESEGRAWPVGIEHRADVRERPMADRICAAVESCLLDGSGQGSVLVFVPGAAEIRAALRALEPVCAREGYDLRPLHGDLPSEEQDRAVMAGPRPRVVVATNLAEASITVEGVVTVIDTGLARVLRRDPRTGLNHLATCRVSRASAAQRAGRAGRNGPGRCLRLYSEAVHASLEEEDEPEIRRIDPSQAILSILAWGARDPLAFPWLDPPAEARVRAALDLLARLGAVEAGAIPRLTERGRSFLALPVHPRHAAVLVEARLRGVEREAAAAVALLSERDLRLCARASLGGEGGPAGGAARGGDAGERFGRTAVRRGDSDLLERLDDLRGAEQVRFDTAMCVARGIDPFAARRASQAAGQVARAASRLPVEPGRAASGRTTRGGTPIAPAEDGRDGALLRAIAAGYPDRLIRRRSPGSAAGRMVGGAGIRLDAGSVVRDAEFFVALEATPVREAGGRSVLVRAASAVRLSWLRELFAACWREEEEAAFDPREERVVGRKRTIFVDLPVEERETGSIDPSRAAEALHAAAIRDLPRAIEIDRDLDALLARLRWLDQALPAIAQGAAASLPPGGDSPGAVALAGGWAPFLLEAVRQQCEGRRSFAELRRAPLRETLLALLSPEAGRRLDRMAPERLRLPSGRLTRVDYPEIGPPVVAARLQEWFGTETTPRVGDGQVPVLLHLLAPNHRPVQVTQDLASFWRSVYPKIRAELRRRYPRHAWPDDPVNASPEQGPRRRPQSRGSGGS